MADLFEDVSGQHPGRRVLFPGRRFVHVVRPTRLVTGAILAGLDKAPDLLAAANDDSALGATQVVEERVSGPSRR